MRKREVIEPRDLNKQKPMPCSWQQATRTNRNGQGWGDSDGV
jgi:hypothetical protein